MSRRQTALQIERLTSGVPFPRSFEEAETFVRHYAGEAGLYLDRSLADLVAQSASPAEWIRWSRIRQGFEQSAELLGREQIRAMVRTV